MRLFMTFMLVVVVTASSALLVLGQDPDSPIITPENIGRVTFLDEFERDLINDLAISPDGQRVALATVEGAYVYDTETFEEVKFLPGMAFQMLNVGWSSDGRYLAYTGQTVHIWDVEADEIWTVPNPEQVFMPDMVWSPDRNVLAIATNRENVQIFDIETREIITELGGAHGDLVTIAWSPNGDAVAAAGDEGIIYVWELDEAMSAQPPLQLESGFQGIIRTIAWSPDGRNMIAAGDEIVVDLWDMEGMVVSQTFDIPFSGVWEIAWSPDGQLVASGNNDGTVWVWEVETGELRREFGIHREQGRRLPILSLVWSPDGTELWTGSKDGYVRVLGIIDGETCGIVADLRVNVRSLPTTELPTTGQLQAGTEGVVIGQFLDEDDYVWWFLADGDWVRSDVVREVGECELVPDINPY